MTGMGMEIAGVHAREVIDCKARPMVEVEVTLENGLVGRGAAPTGSSVGAHEATVLRDGDPRRYEGLGVRGAVANVNGPIARALHGQDVSDQRAIDRSLIELDGTTNKSRLGANAVYSTSVATLRAAALANGRTVYDVLADGAIATLPVPCFNMINGGRFPGYTQAFNEFIVVPHGAESMAEAVEIGVVLFAGLSRRLNTYLGETPLLGGSFGYRAPSADPTLVLELFREAAVACGVDDRVSFALDCAASEMYDPASSTYELNGRQVDAPELIGYLESLTQEFDLLFVEDLLGEDDWDSWSLAHRTLTRTRLLGDDLIVTSRDRLQHAVALDAIDGFILKPNQVGTITEALDTYDLAIQNGLVAIPSGRSGGVVDDIVVDLSVGLQVPFQKNGAPRSGERIEKLNFLLRVADRYPQARIADAVKALRDPFTTHASRDRHTVENAIASFPASGGSL